VEDARSAVEHSGDALRAVKDKAAKKVEAAQERVGAAVEGVKERCGSMKDQAAVCVEKADRYLRDNPYRTLAIGAGIGFLLAVMLRRK
jgi:ElaB/YqjD/DUF883 family membrane-anchored ribosome-binding protein